jgi:hypothetical protein
LMCVKRTEHWSRKSIRMIPNICIAIGPDM